MLTAAVAAAVAPPSRKLRAEMEVRSTERPIASRPRGVHPIPEPRGGHALGPRRPKPGLVRRQAASTDADACSKIFGRCSLYACHRNLHRLHHVRALRAS
jgi:hypothetical protein